MISPLFGLYAYLIGHSLQDRFRPTDPVTIMLDDQSIIIAVKMPHDVENG